MLKNPNHLKLDLFSSSPFLRITLFQIPSVSCDPNGRLPYSVDRTRPNKQAWPLTLIIYQNLAYKENIRHLTKNISQLSRFIFLWPFCQYHDGQQATDKYIRSYNAQWGCMIRCWSNSGSALSSFYFRIRISITERKKHNRDMRLQRKNTRIVPCILCWFSSCDYIQSK